MKIDVYLYATLVRHLPDGAEGRSVALEADENTHVRDVMQQLGVPEKSVKLIFVNGVHAQPETVLKDGDRVGLFPPVGGG